MALDDLPGNVTTDFLRHVVKHGLLTDEAAVDAYDEACRRQRPINEILVDRGILTEHTAESLLRLLYKPAEVKVLAGYQILAKLGEGATATVYKALQLSIDREVALKVMSGQFTRHRLGRERFLREARLAAQVNHPNVVGVHDIGEEGGRLYIAMEFVAGGDARRVAEQYGGALPDRVALRILRDCAEGLVAIRRADMIHRDIKPSNIFVTDKGVAKLADLGLACNELGEDRLTVTGGIIGTPAFMSPEQARGTQQLDVRTDIYSLGASLFDLVIGHPPFQGQNAFMVVHQVIDGPAPEPLDEKPEMSRGLARIIRKCMRYDPDERYQTPQELLGAVQNVLSSHTSVARVRAVGGSSSHRRAVGQDGSGTRPAAERHAARVSRRESRTPAPGRWRRRLLALLLGLLALAGTGYWYGYLREGARGWVEFTELWQDLVAGADDAGSGDPDGGDDGAGGDACEEPEPPPEPEPDPEPEPPPVWQEGSDDHGRYGRLRFRDLTVTFRRIEPGTFSMGSRSAEEGHDDDERLHRVTITEPFWLAAAECGQDLWQEVMDSNPSAYPHRTRPVDSVSWEMARAFLRSWEEAQPGLRLRLPTEAEWEYACRAGEELVYFGEGEYDDLAWHRRTSRRAIGGRQPQPRRQKEPNPWGLYDMLGNVAEWTADAYAPYPVGVVTDPRCESGEMRVYRGGSWNDHPDACRPANRETGAPDGISKLIGFRFVLVRPPPAAGADAAGSGDAGGAEDDGATDEVTGGPADEDAAGAGAGGVEDTAPDPDPVPAPAPPEVVPALRAPRSLGSY